jgi:hypothetical protein
MRERFIVDAVVTALNGQGFDVGTEVPNFYRSADVAAVTVGGEVWVIECKVSDISRAIEQARIHKLAADRVLVATPHRVTRSTTLQRLKCAGLGLMYVMPDGSVTEACEAPRNHSHWPLAKERLRTEIVRQMT